MCIRDRYTGEIKGKYERAPFFTTMFRLHRWLLDSMTPDGGIFWGKMIVGTATLMFVFVLISGIVIWWPVSYTHLDVYKRQVIAQLSVNNDLCTGFLTTL